jgi:hypothetical protein
VHLGIVATNRQTRLVLNNCKVRGLVENNLLSSAAQLNVGGDGGFDSCSSPLLEQPYRSAEFAVRRTST